MVMIKLVMNEKIENYDCYHVTDTKRQNYTYKVGQWSNRLNGINLVPAIKQVQSNLTEIKKTLYFISK